MLTFEKYLKLKFQTWAMWLNEIHYCNRYRKIIFHSMRHHYSHIKMIHQQITATIQCRYKLCNKQRGMRWNLCEFDERISVCDIYSCTYFTMMIMHKITTVQKADSTLIQIKHEQIWTFGYFTTSLFFQYWIVFTIGIIKTISGWTIRTKEAKNSDF